MTDKQFHLVCIDTRPTRRGAQVFVHELSAMLQQRGMQVTKVYLYDAPAEGRLSLFEQDIELKGNDAHVFEKFPTVHPALVKKLRQTLDALQPDVILLNGSRTLKYGAAVKRLLKARPVMLYRVIDSVKFWNNSWFKQQYYRHLILPALDAAVGVSQTSLNEMVQFHHFQKPARAIPRAVDTAHFAQLPDKASCRQQLGAAEEDFICLFLGNLTRQKRPDRLLHILQEARKQVPHAKAWIVGDGILRLQVMQQAEQMGLQQAVRFFGYQQQVGPYIKAADVLVLCSDTEGLPGVVLEAAAAGIPAIAGAVGGVRECIDEGVTGFIVEPNDIAAFAGNIQALAADARKKENMGAAAQEKIKRSFSIALIGEAYENYLRSLAAENRK